MGDFPRGVSSTATGSFRRRVLRDRERGTSPTEWEANKSKLAFENWAAVAKAADQK